MALPEQDMGPSRKERKVRPRVARGVYKSAHFTPNICPIQTSDRAGRREVEGEKSDLVYRLTNTDQGMGPIFSLIFRHQLLKERSVRCLDGCSGSPNTIGLPLFDRPPRCLVGWLPRAKVGECVWQSLEKRIYATQTESESWNLVNQLLLNHHRDYKRACLPSDLKIFKKI